MGTGFEGYYSGEVLDMAKGQAEALFPLIEERLALCDWTLADLDAIGVATGPGNFTGIRISVSAARGLGLALGIPVFGLSQFELTYGIIPVPHGTLISVPAPRNMAYVEGSRLDAGKISAQMIDPAHLPDDLQLCSRMAVFGHRADEISGHFGATPYVDPYQPDPALMATLTEQKYIEALAFPPSPAPNYVKPPDAAPARDVPPRIVP